MIGGFRYGLLADQRQNKSPYDNIGSAILRLEGYQQSGNVEGLIDAANLCMIEFEIGGHPLRHFRAVDDGVHTELKSEGCNQ